jgi:hypothetical protein
MRGGIVMEEKQQGLSDAVLIEIVRGIKEIILGNR